MNNRVSNAHIIFLGGLLLGLLYTLYTPALSACDLLYPNLRPLPASDIELVLDENGDPREVRFSATNWNSGLGRLELHAKDPDTAARKQRVHQRIYDTCAGSQDVNAGEYEWHEGHNHFHVGDFANYFLRPLGSPGQGRNGSKTTFCVMDTTSINPKLLGASGQTYSTCGNTVQGMSVGWGDTYGSALQGQSIDATNLAPSDYELEIVADPFNRIVETNDGDNASCVLLRFAGSPYATSFNILQRRSGRCSDPVVSPSIASLSPNQGPRGWTGTVTIRGSGFDPVMPVSFSNGSSIPTVSKVLFFDDATIEATVKIPAKRRLKDPTVDLNVGSLFSYTGQATKTDAFTIMSP